MIVEISNTHILAWLKNKSFNFVDATERFAQLGGMDSVKNLIGKSDYDLTWNQAADYFRNIDGQILNQKLPSYFNQMEILSSSQTHFDGTFFIQKRDIIVNKSLLTDEYEESIGVVGSCIDITGYSLIKKNAYTDEHGNFYLGRYFGNTYLTKRELSVFKLVLLGDPIKIIAKKLNLSYRTVETYVNNIKLKLQCRTKGDIIYTAIHHGLSYIVFGV